MNKKKIKRVGDINEKNCNTFDKVKSIAILYNMYIISHCKVQNRVFINIEKLKV